MEFFPLFHLLAMLATGLIGGLYLTMDNTILPGLEKLDDKEYFRLFHRVGQVIHNPFYNILLFGAHLAQLLACILSFLSEDSMEIYFLALATVIYGLGVIWVSIRWIVPLHVELAARAANKGLEENGEFRETFRHRWKRYNRIRLTAAAISFLLLLFTLLST